MTTFGDEGLALKHKKKKQKENDNDNKYIYNQCLMND